MLHLAACITRCLLCVAPEKPVQYEIPLLRLLLHELLLNVRAHELHKVLLSNRKTNRILPCSDSGCSWAVGEERQLPKDVTWSKLCRERGLLYDTRKIPESSDTGKY